MNDAPIPFLPPSKPMVEGWVGDRRVSEVGHYQTKRVRLVWMGQAMCDSLEGAEAFLRHQVTVLPVEFAVLVHPSGCPTAVVAGVNEYVEILSASLWDIEGGVVTHSHPVNHSLSLSDIQLAVDFNLRQVRAVLPCGEVHVYAPPVCGEKRSVRSNWKDDLAWYIARHPLMETFVEPFGGTKIAITNAALWEDAARAVGGRFSIEGMVIPR